MKLFRRLWLFRNLWLSWWGLIAKCHRQFPVAFNLARLEGFEPPTPGSEDQCSSPLSYRRLCCRIYTGEAIAWVLQNSTDLVLDQR